MAAPARLDDLRLLELLADGAWHTGEQLAAVFDVSRAAISKRLGGLKAAGWQLATSKQRGYRIDGGLDLLDAGALDAALPDLAVTVLAQVDSTNAAVMAQAFDGPQVVLAEHQTAGRGRRGRSWTATPGQHLTLTVDWRFERLAAPAIGLSPAIAVAVAQGLGLPAVRIKWPNDLVVPVGRTLHKLGGVLIEASGEASGPLRVVVGIGLNVADVPMADIDQPWSSLRGQGEQATRSELAVQVVRAVVDALQQFERHGLQATAEQFAALDALAGQSITIEGSAAIEAKAAGLAPDGGLRVATAAGEQVVYSGDVSVRLR